MVKVLNIDCGSTGYGLMGFNFPPVTPHEVAIPVMKKALEAGSTYWAAAEYYGTPDNNSLHLLHAYFKQHPEDVDKVCVSVKIGFDGRTMQVKADEASIRASFANCERILDGVKKIDILTIARVDPEIPIEESVKVLSSFVREGKVGAVGMSECAATTLRRAAAICPIAAVEVEFSLFTPDILSNGVAEAAHDVGAVIAAYSPLGRGVLTGTITADSLGANDPRRHHPRFQEEALNNNLKLVAEVNTIAERLHATSGQVALAWLRARSGSAGFPEILPIPGTRSLTRLEENTKMVELQESDVRELDEIVKRNPAMGARYPGAVAKLNWG